MRKLPVLVPVVAIGVLLTGLAIGPSDAVTAPKPGTKCSPLGRTVKVAGFSYKCVKVKGKLVWSKPTKVVVTPPSPTPSPKPSPLPTPIPVIAPTAPPAPPGNVSTSRYAFLAVSPKGVPAHWSSCSPITWTYFEEKSRPYGLGVAQTALQAIANATGFTFKYVDPGTTPEPKWDVIGNPDAPANPAQLQIMFGDASNIPQLTGGTLGITAPYWNGDNQIQVAYVVVRPDATYGAKDFGFGGLGLVFMHELAHAMGLDHVSSVSDLMYPDLWSIQATAFAAGDLAGLYKVSAAIPCGA